MATFEEAKKGFYQDKSVFIDGWFLDESKDGRLRLLMDTEYGLDEIILHKDDNWSQRTDWMVEE